MQETEFKAGAKEGGPMRRKALRQQIEVGRVDEKQPAPAESGQAAPDEKVHAVGRGPGAVAKDAQALSSAGQDRFHHRQAARLAVAGRQVNLDVVDAAPAA